MKKLIFISSTITSFLTPVSALAASPSPSGIVINPPTQGYNNLGSFITNVMTFAFTIAVLVVLVMLIWGAFEWIASGGDKESVGKARNRIINALIGLAVLAVAFALARVGAQFAGINLLDLPVPAPPSPSP